MELKAVFVFGVSASKMHTKRLFSKTWKIKHVKPYKRMINSFNLKHKRVESNMITNKSLRACDFMLERMLLLFFFCGV